MAKDPAASPLLKALLGAQAVEAGATKAAKAASPKQVKVQIAAASPLPMDMSAPMKRIRTPGPVERLKSDARYEKESATRRWVRGDISSKQHQDIHKRANAVLSAPHRFVKHEPSGVRGVRGIPGKGKRK